MKETLPVSDEMTVDKGMNTAEGDTALGQTEVRAAGSGSAAGSMLSEAVGPKKNKKMYLLIGGFVVAALLVVGVGTYLVFQPLKGADTTTVTTKQTLPEQMTVLLTGDAISGIFPNSAPEVYETNFQRNIFQSLTQVKEDGRAVGLLAKSWTNPSSDVWLFTLRDDAMFSNGTMVTAKDVAFSITESMAKEWPGSEQLGLVKKVEAVGDDQVKITTDGTDPILLNELSQVLIVNQAQYEAKKADEYAIGSGPYALTKVETDKDGGKRYILTASEHYHLAKPEVKTLTVLSQPEDADRVEYGLQHDASVILASSLTPEQEKTLKSKGYELQSTASNGVNLIGFDTVRDASPYVNGGKNNPLKNIKVRQALYKAIDWTALAQTPPDASWITASQLAPVSVFGHDSSLKAPAFDVSAAKKLLSEAGYGSGFALTIDTPANNEEQLTAITKNWKDIGVTVTVNPLGKTDGLPKLMKHDTSAFYISWEYGTYDFASSFADLITSGSQLNFGQYSLPAATALQKELSSVVSLEQRKTKSQQLQKALLDDVGFIPVWFSSDVHAVKKNIDFVDALPVDWKAK